MAFPAYERRSELRIKLAKVLDVEHIAEGLGVVRLRLEEGFSFEPGQFVMVWLPSCGEKPFSIVGLEGRTLKLLVKRVGPFTSALLELEEGQSVGVRGPYGRGFEGERGFVLGGGVGIAPLLPLLERLKEWEAFFCFRSEPQVPLELLEDLDAKVVTDNGSYGLKLSLEEILRRVSQNSTLYACGPEQMLKKVLDFSLKEKISCQLSVERYVKCGIGICGHCVLDPKGLRVCVEGPVFSAQELEGTVFGKYKRDASFAKVLV